MEVIDSRAAVAPPPATSPSPPLGLSLKVLSQEEEGKASAIPTPDTNEGEPNKASPHPTPSSPSSLPPNDQSSSQKSPPLPPDRSEYQQAEDPLTDTAKPLPTEEAGKESCSSGLHPMALEARTNNGAPEQPYKPYDYKDSEETKDYYRSKEQESGSHSVGQSTNYQESQPPRFPFDPSDPRNFHQHSPSEMPVQGYNNLSHHQDSPTNPENIPSGGIRPNHHRNSPFIHHRASPHLTPDGAPHMHGSPHLHQDTPHFHHHPNGQQYPPQMNPLSYSSSGRPPIDSPHGHHSPLRKEPSDGRYADFHPPHHSHLSPSPQRPPYHDHMMKDSPHHPMQESNHDYLHLKNQTGAPDSYWNMHLESMSNKVKQPDAAKDWYENNDSMMSDRTSADQGYPNSIPHHNMGSEPHENSPINPNQHMTGNSNVYSPQQQNPNSDPQNPSSVPGSQHYPGYPGHGIGGSMSPISPGYQGSQRGQGYPYMNDPAQQYGQFGSQHSYHGQQGYPGALGHPGGGREGDPYSFVDEYTGPSPRPVDEVLGNNQPKRRGRKPKHIKLMETGGDPMVIAAAQAAHEAKKRKVSKPNIGPDGKIVPTIIKPRKKMDRFEGLPEDELTKRILPDHLGPNLDIVIIGINPGLFAAYKGHHYAGPGNHFWKCLFLSGLIPEPLTCDDDHQLLHHGIGFTNIVARTTRGSAELTRKEIKEGGQHLLSKLQQYQPRIAVFNGKGIYEIFSGKKEFSFGRQSEKIEGTNTHVWVMPSSSARCAQLPRALDKVPFYTALRKFKDFLKGNLDELKEEDIAFANLKIRNLKKDPEKMAVLAGDSLLKGEAIVEDFMGNDDILKSRELIEGEIRKEMTRDITNPEGMNNPELGMEMDPMRQEILGNPSGDNGIRREMMYGANNPMPGIIDEDAMKLEINDLGIKEELEEEEELSKITPQSLFKLNGMSREQLESLECPTIPIRKKRGRPKKTPDDPNAPERSRARSISAGNQQVPHMGPDGSMVPGLPGNLGPSAVGMHGPPPGMLCNGLSPPMMDDMPRKKRGRPKKLLPDGSVPPPKRPGRKPKALKEMLQQQVVHGPQLGHLGGFDGPPHHLAMNHINGIMSPQGFSPNHTNQTFSPQSANSYNQGSLMGNPGMHNPQQYMHPHSQMGHMGPGGPMSHNGPLTPGSNPGLHPAMHSLNPGSQTPVGGRGPTPHQFGQSPGYSPGHHIPPHYPPGAMNHHPEHMKQENLSHMEDEHQLGLSPPPASPGIAHQDFDHPTSLPDAESQAPVIPSDNTRSPAGHIDQQNMQSNPNTPIDHNNPPSGPPYPQYAPSYPPAAHHSPAKHSPGMGMNINKGDVASKSLSGLESLVDQIPSISGDHQETSSQHSTHSSTHSNTQSNVCSNPNTPAPPHHIPQQPHPPFSPSQSSFNSSTPYPPQTQSYNSPQHPYSPHYSSPQAQPPSYSPHYTSSAPTNSTSNNFSVSSLAQSSTPVTSPPSTPSTSSFSVSSLTGGSPTPAPSLYSSSSYSPANLPHSSYPEIMGSPMLAPTPPMGSSFMGSHGLMGSPGAMPGSGSMGPMSPGPAQNPYSYTQYGESGSAHYPGPGSHPSFAHYPTPAPPGFHVPPRFPYPSPYGNSPYSQGYSQNSMLERIKHSGMGMGFGGF